MEQRGQTSIEYILLIAGIIIIVALIGYTLVGAAQNVKSEVNSWSK